MLKMLVRTLFLVLLVTTTAQAQQVSPAVPAEYTLKLTNSQVNTIFGVLNKYAMPYEVSAPLLQELATQVRDQNKSTAKPEAAKPE
jgi:hypothetical protein